MSELTKLINKERCEPFPTTLGFLSVTTAQPSSLEPRSTSSESCLMPSSQDQLSSCLWNSQGNRLWLYRHNTLWKENIISRTWNHVRNANSQVLPQIQEIINSKGGARHWSGQYLTKTPGDSNELQSLRTLGLQNQDSTEFSLLGGLSPDYSS